MNILRIVSLVLLVSSLLTVSIVSAYAQYPQDGEKYETLGVRHDTRPNVCLFEPNPTYVDWNYWKDVEFESWKAILDWQIEMTKFTNGEDWSMHIFNTVPYIEHWNKTPDDYRHCSIFLTYEAWNTKKNSGALGLTGIDFKKSSHKFMYIVVYLHAVENNKIVLDIGDIKENNNGTVKFDIKSEREELPLNSVYNIVLHELGHGLGLGHYTKSVKDGYTKSVMFPSLDPFNEQQKFKITMADKFMLTQIYGFDGYYKPHPIIIPDYCLFLNDGLMSNGCY